MKPNGFTLVELIGVVAVIAIIMLVAIPQVMSTMNNSNVKEKEAFAHDMEAAASSYVENNWNDFKIDYQTRKTSDGYYCLSLLTLVKKGYLSNTEIDPETNQAMDFNGKYVLLKNISSSSGAFRFSFEYVGSSSSICVGWS